MYRGDPENFIFLNLEYDSGKAKSKESSEQFRSSINTESGVPENKFDVY